MERVKKNLPIILAAVIVFALVITLFALLLPKKEEPKEIDEGNGRPAITETRGVFVPTVYNLSFPSKADLTEAELKSEIDTIIETAKAAGLNSIFFQVRPACDALYNSEYFPVSEYLSTSGNMQFDCLEYITEACHKEGMALHAWINPLRVSASAADVSELDPDSPALKIDDSVVSYGGKLYFDPGIPRVRELICKGVREICENYNVDGIIFDDYFYPYKVYETTDDGNRVVAAFADDETYSAYGGDFTSVEDFRRANINSLIKSVYETVKSVDESRLFGVSCFGIWQNVNGENGGSYTKGTESYNETYSDTLSWVEGGYVDYIAPQIYWETNDLVASYKVLAKWWDARLEDTDVDLLIAHAAYKYDGTFDTESLEMTKQLTLTEELTNYKGSIFYSYNAVRDDLGGITGEIKDYYVSKDESALVSSEDERK